MQRYGGDEGSEVPRNQFHGENAAFFVEIGLRMWIFIPSWSHRLDGQDAEAVSATAPEHVGRQRPRTRRAAVGRYSVEFGGRAVRRLFRYRAERPSYLPAF